MCTRRSSRKESGRRGVARRVETPQCDTRSYYRNGKLEGCNLLIFYFALAVRLVPPVIATANQVFVLLATFQCSLFSRPIPTMCFFLFSGVVPERASEVAAYGDKTGKQDGGQVFTGRLPGDGHVPRSYGIHPVIATTQPALQRHGRPAQPELHGLPITPALRHMSAVREPTLGSVAFLLDRWKLERLTCGFGRLVLNI